MPDMSAMYKISDSSIKSPTLKLKPYDYQDYGIRFMIDKILKRGFVLNADDVGLGNIWQNISNSVSYVYRIKEVYIWYNKIFMKKQNSYI